MWPTFYIPSGNVYLDETYVNQSSEICGNSITFDLDVDLPGIQAGDYVVYFVRVNNGGDHDSATVHERMIQQPAEVECIWQEPRYNRHKQSFESNMANAIWANVYGEFITDTTVTRTFTRNSTNYGLCGFALAYRGANRLRPVTYLESTAARVTGGTLPYVGTEINNGVVYPAVKTNSTDVAWVFRCMHGQRAAFGSFGGTPGTYYGDRSLNGSVYTAYTSVASAVGYHAAWRAWHEYGTLSEMPVNLLPWDQVTTAGSVTEGIYTSGWNLNGVTRANDDTGSYQVQRIYGNGSAGTHDLYCDVTLTAGEQYFFSVMLHGLDDASVYTALIIENPSAVEEGFTFAPEGYPGISLYNKIGTHSHVPFMHTPDADGIPVDMTGVVGMVYTAGATGTHRVKIAMADKFASGALSFVASTASYISINHAQLTLNRLGVGGPDGVTAGWRKWISAGIEDTTTYGQYCSMAFCINRLSDSFAEAKLEAHYPECSPEGTFYPEWADFSTKLAINADEIIGQNGQNINRVHADQWVFPTYRTTPEGSPVTGKYYAEITVDNITPGTLSVWTEHTSSRKFQTEDTTYGQCIGYGSTGGTAVPEGCTASATPASFTTGDVIGVAIDYSTERTTFYKNGTEQFYVAWPTAWMDGGGMPLRLAFNLGPSTGSPAFTVNMKGPFTYKPVGFVAYDVFNEA